MCGACLINRQSTTGREHGRATRGIKAKPLTGVTRARTRGARAEELAPRGGVGSGRPISRARSPDGAAAPAPEPPVRRRSRAPWALPLGRGRPGDDAVPGLCGDPGVARVQPDLHPVRAAEAHAPHDPVLVLEGQGELQPEHLLVPGTAALQEDTQILMCRTPVTRAAMTAAWQDEDPASALARPAGPGAARGRGTPPDLPDGALSISVGKGGVEPPRPFGHTDLNRARLPFRHLPWRAPTLAVPRAATGEGVGRRSPDSPPRNHHRGVAGSWPVTRARPGYDHVGTA
jgi:hypothetical protein